MDCQHCLFQLDEFVTVKSLSARTCLGSTQELPRYLLRQNHPDGLGYLTILLHSALVDVLLGIEYL